MDNNSKDRDKSNKSNRNHSDVSVNSDSALGVTAKPSAMNLEFNESQDSQGRDELIMEKQIQRHKQEKPTTATEQKNSDMQQSLTHPADQTTLTDQPRHDLSSWEDVEGRIGISLYGPCCHGPRVLLIVTEDA